MTAPAIILVRPQMGENIGAAARAMANFGLSDLRIVAPRDGWPNPAAEAMAAGGRAILEGARLFDSATEAVADLHRVWAATARRRDMLKPEVSPAGAAADLRAAPAGEAGGVLFGPERSGLDNDETALADAILRAPTAPGAGSINLAQCVLLVGYEWFKAGNRAPGRLPPGSGARPATREELEGFFRHLTGELDRCGFLRNRQQRPIVVRNLRNLFLRAGLFEREVRALRGVVACLVKDEKPPKV